MTEYWFQVDIRNGDGVWESTDVPGVCYSEVYCRALLEHPGLDGVDLKVNKCNSTWAEFQRDVNKDRG